MSGLSTAASKPKVKTTGESILFGFDFTPLLTGSETLTGTPTVTCTATSETGGATTDLTVSGSPIVNIATFTNDEGGTVAIGAGIQCRISAGHATYDYTIKVSCGTSLANTREMYCTLQVRNT